MKKVSIDDLPEIAASHENNLHPGSFKKIMFDKTLFPSGGQIQMINWARIPKGKSFTNHLHEDMMEIFIILQGQALIFISQERMSLMRGDAVIIPVKTPHKMKNIGRSDLLYLVIGYSIGRGGKTIILK